MDGTPPHEPHSGQFSQAAQGGGGTWSSLGAKLSKSDREHRSNQCKSGEHDQCGGYYDTSGSACGYDTYTCLCSCHTHPTPPSRGTTPS